MTKPDPQANLFAIDQIICIESWGSANVKVDPRVDNSPKILVGGPGGQGGPPGPPYAFKRKLDEKGAYGGPGGPTGLYIYKEGGFSWGSAF
jgi:hypothetical protein